MSAFVFFCCFGILPLFLNISYFFFHKSCFPNKTNVEPYFSLHCCWVCPFINGSKFSQMLSVCLKCLHIFYFLFFCFFLKAFGFPETFLDYFLKIFRLPIYSFIFGNESIITLKRSPLHGSHGLSAECIKIIEGKTSRFMILFFSFHNS